MAQTQKKKFVNKYNFNKQSVKRSAGLLVTQLHFPNKQRQLRVFPMQTQYYEAHKADTN